MDSISTLFVNDAHSGLLLVAPVGYDPASPGLLGLQAMHVAYVRLVGIGVRLGIPTTGCICGTLSILNSQPGVLIVRYTLCNARWCIMAR
jgi:hypothetical protein